MIATTEDAFIGGRLMLHQPREGHRAGLDAVMLAASVAARAGERVLEAGSGSGVVSLLVARRLEGVQADGVEIEPALVTLASRNAAANALDQRVAFHAGDVTQGARALEAAGLPVNGFDHVIANPPFLADGEGRAPDGHLRRRAGTMPKGGLDLWLRFLAAACRPGGSLRIVHRADALPRLLAAAAGRFGALGVLPLHPRPGEPATRLILTGVKGSSASFRLLPGLVLHGEGNVFTGEAAAILRDGAGLRAV
jgi:tRNA1(Val) A37 N6-methylase TrmN6